MLLPAGDQFSKRLRYLSASRQSRFMASRPSVDILTGFLGSGKTTLLNRLLAGGFTDTAVVVNELGEIGLDHLLVAEQTETVAVLEGGCLCCEVVDSLPETLLELCRGRAAGSLPGFRRIVIETTGLADPAPIMRLIRNSSLLRHFLAAGIVVTAFDMLSGAELIGRHPEVRAQLALADRIVLTKLDRRGPFSDEERAALVAINPLAEIVPAEAILADPERLVAGAPEPAEPPEADGRAHHSHGVAAYSFPIDGPATRSGLACWSAVLAQRFGPALLRAKGVVRVGTRLVLVQGVGADFRFEDFTGGSMVPALTCIVQYRSREEVEATLSWLSVPEGTQPPSPEECLA